MIFFLFNIIANVAPTRAQRHSRCEKIGLDTHATTTTTRPVFFLLFIYLFQFFVVSYHHDKFSLEWTIFFFCFKCSCQCESRGTHLQLHMYIIKSRCRKTIGHSHASRIQQYMYKQKQKVFVFLIHSSSRISTNFVLKPLVDLQYWRNPVRFDHFFNNLIVIMHGIC